MTHSLEPTELQLKALQTAAIEGPVTMLNLLRFKADGGRERYAAYAAAAAPFLRKAGATVRYRADSALTVIGTEAWDEVILVDYPSIQAFFEMTGHPEYPSALRRGALEDSRLICSQATG